MVRFIGDISIESIVNGVYKPTYNVWGAPPCNSVGCIGDIFDTCLAVLGPRM